ncbi:unnamed protein product [Aphanomyces euteiches]|uniref:RING-type domain-containing protein n=1 Tax=Aphanomyces euteiches TaxID=100861 RepID=A0A6G0WQ41_9STRA|nr:hypothetical protein Ae201684_012792 [Aphanomyces euteiches]KAH9097609.1 hypothetical protein Ae201684P_001085 [Aphanomyces euteiches]KAH9144226.1 hypothetical protein AeRB84_011822 [Aphanomyces euteiches]
MPKLENVRLATSGSALVGATFTGSSQISTGDEAVQVTGAVQSNIMLDDFNITFYTIRIKSPVTKALWMIRWRYSQAYANRKHLLKMAEACPQPLHDQVVALLKRFPRRRLGLDNEFVIMDRAEGLKIYVLALMKIQELCMEYKETAVVALKTEIEVTLKLPAVYHVDAFQWKDAPSCDPMCSICLEDMQENESCVRLRCEHTFHMACVSEWLRRDVSCPLCREQA